jgi:hypothetical protein
MVISWHSAIGVTRECVALRPLARVRLYDFSVNAEGVMTDGVSDNKIGLSSWGESVRVHADLPL